MTKNGMKTGTKRVLTIALALVLVGFLFTALGGALGGFRALDNATVFGHTIRIGNSGYDRQVIEVDSFKKAEINVQGIDVVFHPDSRFYVEYNVREDSPRPEVKVEDGVLKVTAKYDGVGAGMGIVGEDDVWRVDFDDDFTWPQIDIHCPANTELNSIKADITACDLTIDQFGIRNLDVKAVSCDVALDVLQLGAVKLDVATGDVSMRDVNMDTLEAKLEGADFEAQNCTVAKKTALDARNGETEFYGNLKGTSTIKADTGELSLDMADNESDYNYSIKTANVDAELNGDTIEQREVKNPGAANTMTVEMNNGELELWFGSYHFDDED